LFFQLTKKGAMKVKKGFAAVIMILLFIISLPLFLSARVGAGNIMGKVVGPDGKPIPGVTVTIKSRYVAAMKTVTSRKGMFRFLALPAGDDYSLKLERAGLRTKLETGFMVETGSSRDLTLTMTPGQPEETETGIAVTPVIDRRETARVFNAGRDMLQSLPTTRDPWAVLRLAPAVIVDRGGSGWAEPGLPVNHLSLGAKAGGQNVWNLDGVDEVEPAAAGVALPRCDFDSCQEMQIKVGGSDVTAQTGGVVLNMTGRRGGNEVSLGGRFYFSDNILQSTNAKEVARIKEVENPAGASNLFQGINRIKGDKDYGVDLGLPLIREKIWIWFSHGVRDTKTSTIYATPYESLCKYYAGKINLQLFANNRLEFFLNSADLEKDGYAADSANPEGLTHRDLKRWGNPVLKLQDEQKVGNGGFLSFKFASSGQNFVEVPISDLDFNNVPVYDVTEGRYYGSQSSRNLVDRSFTQYDFLATFYNEKIFGLSHEFKLGLEYSRRKQYVESDWSGNMTVYGNYRSTDAAWDIDGDEIPDGPVDDGVNYFSFWRGFRRDQRIDSLGIHLGDTISIGRFNFIVGLRYDWQRPHNAPVTLSAMDSGGAWQAIAEAEVQTALGSLLPGLEVPETYAAVVGESGAATGGKYAWRTFSPRIGITWDIFGKGKFVAKLNVARYGEFMTTDVAGWADAGGTAGRMNFWWWDTSGDGRIQMNEFYWLHRRSEAGDNFSPYRVFDDLGAFTGDWADAAGYYWDGYDPDNPLVAGDPYVSVANNVGSPRTTEMMFGLEAQIKADFAVSLSGTYRKYDRFNWAVKYWLEEGERKYADMNMFASRGVPESFYYRNNGDGSITVYIPGTGGAADQEWYSAAADYNVYSRYSERRINPGYSTDYFGVDLAFNKRLSHGWMFNGSFTWQRQAQHYRGGSVLDLTNVWAYNGRPVTGHSAGFYSGTNQYAFSRWLLKLSGLFELPFGMAVSGTLNMREGWIQDEYFTLVDYRISGTETQSADIVLDYAGNRRLPMVYDFSLRLEKSFNIQDVCRIHLMLDIFNVFNQVMKTGRYPRYWGTVRLFPGSEGDIDWTKTSFSPNATFDALNEILNPRVLRLGLRFQF